MESELLYFMKANDEMAEDLEDGAWMQFLQDSVKKYNEMNGTKYDPYDTTMDYVKLTATKQ